MSRFASFILAGLAACATAPPDSELELAESHAALGGRVVLGPVLAASWPDGFAIHGVGGDELLPFAVQPTNAPTRARGVHVARRLDGALLGDLAPPPGGWGTPLTIKIESHARSGPLATSGTFLLMDAATPPAFAGSAPVRLQEEN